MTHQWKISINNEQLHKDFVQLCILKGQPLNKMIEEVLEFYLNAIDPEREKRVEEIKREKFKKDKSDLEALAASLKRRGISFKNLKL